MLAGSLEALLWPLRMPLDLGSHRAGQSKQTGRAHYLWLSASSSPSSLCKAECENFCGQKSPRNGPIRHLEERKVKPRETVAVLTPEESTAVLHIKGTARKRAPQGGRGQVQPAPAGSPHLPTSSLVLTLTFELLGLLSLRTPSVSHHTRAPL